MPLPAVRVAANQKRGMGRVYLSCKACRLGRSPGTRRWDGRGLVQTQTRRVFARDSVALRPCWLHRRVTEDIFAFSPTLQTGPAAAWRGLAGVAAQGEAFWELPPHRQAQAQLHHLLRPRPSCQLPVRRRPRRRASSARARTVGSPSSGNEEDNEDDNEDAIEDNDDAFTELPQYREFLISRRRRSANRGRPKRNGPMRRQDSPPSDTSGSSNRETEAEPRGEEESPPVLSPWSDSMSQLMKKLDQLNLDIEEALSAGSSPSGTPAVARKQMPGVAPETAGDPVPGEDGAAGCQSQNCTSSSSCLRRNARGSGARARKTKGTVKMSQGAAEIEAKEACDWLRAAGFPQYSQLYEDSQFPIDISAVKKDHDFLDKDLVEPLCRRLITLNKCASMKLDVNIPKKKKEDSDEEDLFAISDRWTFERRSRRWSRLQDIDSFLGGAGGGAVGAGLRAAASSESVLTDLSEPEVSSLHSESSGGQRESPDSAPSPSPSVGAVLDHQHAMLPRVPGDVAFYGSLPAKSRRLGRTRAKDFLRRMELLRSRGNSSSSSAKTGHKGALVISAPVLRREPEALRTLRCVEVLNGEAEPPSGSAPPSHSSGEGSGQSETSGSATSTPCAQERRPHAGPAHKRGGMYLEDAVVSVGVHTMAAARRAGDPSRRSEFRSYEDLVVHIPQDHKPGTFPKALSVESLTPAPARGGEASFDWRVSAPRPAPGAREPRLLGQCCPRGSRLSVYDNVPGSHLYASTGDLMDLEKEELFPHLDDVLQHVSGLQNIVNHWSKNVLPEGGVSRGGVMGGVCDGGGVSGLQSCSQTTLDFEGNSTLEGTTTPSDGDRDGVSLNDTDSTGTRERRDSGVGASLTRPSRLRWPSFRISNRLSQSGASLQITSQPAAQLSLLQKFSLLRLTAIMEKYSMSNKHGWTWSVPKFMKRMKVPDYKDKTVFGVPLIVHVQRTGQPLPLSLQQALRYLRSQCLDQVGLFRKSGVKSRIQALRQMNESSPDDVAYEEQSAYDVADMVKQFFRDLPEPLLTSKLGETFLHIYQYVPKDQRLQAVQAAIMLMSDENREVLQTLLCFLSDVTSSVEENQMTPMNIAVCLAPSLFHLNILRKDNLSPRAMQKKYSTGRPDQKDLSENLAATQGLAHMITECNRLFEIPHEMVTQSRNSYVEAELPMPSLEELCKHLEEHGGSYHAHLDGLVQNLLKEARDRSKSWVTCTSADSTEVSYKKVGDGNPLRRWRVTAEVEAPPSVVLNRVLRERHLWDVDLLQWKVPETLDKQTEVYQYLLNRMPPHPSRDFVVLRSWRTDMPKGTCALVSMSVEHEEAPPLGGVRGVVLESQYLLEPCSSGRSRLTHICRVDLKGRTPEWYNKAFGHLCAAEAVRIRDSFQPLDTDGPETKI
ncbi:hypothetical protein SKAU_G00325460 [Synaphobranchus kaupii]|uniref:StAR-related lipid transfer protein 13 n=1 Tax=Synaphobranchus kaupii TaxID=118154 RepID=A0A9Q1EPR0_SYNKA|nr:hypothetical protein SKAU_G00325460 [Synaphobranchus kaupii]